MFCIQKKTHSRYCLFQPSVRRALFSFSSSVSEKLVFFSFFSEFPNTGIGLDVKLNRYFLQISQAEIRLLKKKKKNRTNRSK